VAVVNLKRKTKRPRLSLSLGASVDQPSPKCCSITRIGQGRDSVNGTEVPEGGTIVLDRCLGTGPPSTILTEAAPAFLPLESWAPPAFTPPIFFLPSSRGGSGNVLGGIDSWLAVGPPFLCFSFRSTTVGAPSLRFLQGRARCCLHHLVSGSGNTRPSLQASVVPALRAEREGRGTPLLLTPTSLKAWATRLYFRWKAGRHRAFTPPIFFPPSSRGGSGNIFGGIGSWCPAFEKHESWGSRFRSGAEKNQRRASPPGLANAGIVAMNNRTVVAARRMVLYVISISCWGNVLFVP